VGFIVFFIKWAFKKKNGWVFLVRVFATTL